MPAAGQELPPAQIKRMRMRHKASQAVFAVCLNTSPSTVQKREQGQKKPNGRSLEINDEQGRSPCGQWFDRLNVTAAVRVATAIHRMEEGNRSNVKGVGAGVYEYRLDFGSGYRTGHVQSPTKPLACNSFSAPGSED